MQANPPHPSEVVAWVAASVGVGLSLVQAAFNAVREHRVRRQEQARFGYQLLDTLFEDKTASRVLAHLDSGQWAGSGRRAEAEDVRFRRAFEKAFGSEPDSESQEAVEARLDFDAVLYYFDRIQHAIDAKLTRFADIRAPLVWYVTRLRPFRPAIEVYAKGVYYHRAVRLLQSFPEWEPTPSTSGTVAA